MKFTTIVLAAALVASTSGLARAADQQITEDDIIAAQTAWANALVAIATAYDEQGEEEARKLAVAAIDRYYNHENGPSLFKPTLAQEPHRFRTTDQGAIAYFVGGDPDFPADTGFALKGWRDVAVDNAAIFIDDNIGMSMGDVTITDVDGNTVSVDKTWGFKKLDNGDVVIVLHHSSIPYSE